MARPIQQARTIDRNGRELPIVRCPSCRRRLFDGYLHGAIKCQCNRLVKFIAERDEQEYKLAKHA